MEADARRMRPGCPFVFSNLKDGTGVDAITRFIGETGGLTRAMGHLPQCNTQFLSEASSSVR